LVLAAGYEADRTDPGQSARHPLIPQLPVPK